MVIGWLTKLALVLAVLGVLLFDSASLVIGRVSVADHADNAAQAAADSWRQQHSYQAALLAAQSAAGTDEVVPNSLVIAADGGTTVVLHHDVQTLVVQHVPQLHDLTTVTGTGNARPPVD